MFIGREKTEIKTAVSGEAGRLPAGGRCFVARASGRAAALDAELGDGAAAGGRGRGRLGPGGGGAAGDAELPLNRRNGFLSSTVSAISPISPMAAVSVCLPFLAPSFWLQ